MSNNIKVLFSFVSASGFILDSVDKFENGGYFFRKVKQTGKQFFKELAKLEDVNAEFVDAEVMSESYEVFESILSASLTIDQKKKKSFNKEILKVINKYNEGNN